MRARVIGPVLILVCALAGVAGWTARAQKRAAVPVTPAVAPVAAPARATWEYKIVGESEKVALNDLGAQGWELVAVTNGGAEEVYFFKRAK
ncbi:MAG: hypothetical protein ABIP75_09915 [Pyrinomonadaceae bacterium]